MAIKVLIADDHTLIRQGIASLLSPYEDIEMVGEAASGEEAVKKAEELRPTVILMDIAMPGLGGLEATLEIRKSDPDVKILVLTQYRDSEYVSRFLKAGCAGYIIKSAEGSELVKAIRVVARGEYYLDSSVTSEVIEGFLEKESGRDPGLYDRLTDREKSVLKLIAEGNTHRRIAETLKISEKTVATHQTNISQKTGLHSKTELIKFAIKSGIVNL